MDKQISLYVARVAAALSLLLVPLLVPADAQAASVTDLYLFSTFTTNPNPSAGVTPPFTLTGTGGVRLGLDGSAVATSQTGLVGPVSAFIDSTVTYQGHSGRIDRGENGPHHNARVNSQVGRLDDVGFVSEGNDAARNIDFKNNAQVILTIPGGGFTSLMIAEDAGLDPFRLERCSTADCSGPRQLLFNGFDSATRRAVLARSDFDRRDSSAIDQIYLFLFDGPMDGWLLISETRNFGGERLEVDFVGGLDPPVTGTPEPTTLFLWGTTAVGLALARWRRRRLGE